MNGKGDKPRVKWSKDYAKNFDTIFKNRRAKKCQNLEKDQKKD